MDPARAPDGPVAVPAVVRTLAAGRPLVPVWRNGLGGFTFRVGDDLHVKWHPATAPYDPAADLAAEATRIAWLAPHTPVPTVVAAGADAEGSWLVTETLPGRSAVDARFRSDPAPVVEALGHGLRRFHDHVPVARCPYDWSAASRVADARRRHAAGTLADDRRLPPEFAGVSLEETFAILEHPPPDDLLVVCHGDACAPNTLVDDDGSFVAHVDLARVGVADRWADLAVASWSLEWNFGPGWEPRFFAAYGIEPDRDRMAWYRLLWEC